MALAHLSRPVLKWLLRASDGEQGAEPDQRQGGCGRSSVTVREAAPPAAPAASHVAIPFRQATSGTVSVSLLHWRSAAGCTRRPYVAFAAGTIRARSTGRLARPNICRLIIFNRFT